MPLGVLVLHEQLALLHASRLSVANLHLHHQQVKKKEVGWNHQPSLMHHWDTHFHYLGDMDLVLLDSLSYPVMRTSAGDSGTSITEGIVDRRLRLGCMADPKRDHGFLYNPQGLVDILQSPFFDLNLEVDDSVEDYVNRILFTLAPSIEEHLPTGHWRIIGHPPTSPPLANLPWIKTLGILLLVVASLRLLRFSLC
ncbi:hypothetical protein M5K25_013963 [Dendrobium thyrsiflorum]|uniref:Uncharacterized protein n=1 Tax=Dendrobium thyrsiflorum TaxID=117978 RepID=A0ABD0V1J8_DENTH